MKHRFQCRSWDDRIRLSRWVCRNCGMKIGSTQAAKQLEGKPCR